MFVIYSAERPSLAQVWLVVSTRDPPLTAFLEDADDLCRLAPSTEAEALDRAPDPMPDYDLLAVPRDQRGAVLQAWTEDLSRYNKRRNDGAPSGKVWLCDQQDYLGAALARSDATRDRREASHALGSFTGSLLSAPLFLLIAGLFLLWSPFRRGD